MSSILRMAAMLVALASFAQPAMAQEGFRLGYTDVGADHRRRRDRLRVRRLRRAGRARVPQHARPRRRPHRHSGRRDF